MERTLILVKPDAFARGLTGEIIARFERKGLKIVALQQHDRRPRSWPSSTTPSTPSAPFFGELVEFITSGPIVAMVLEGEDAIKAARQVIGATNPLEAAPGSIRGDFAIAVGQNMVHGSDSPESGRARGRAVLPRAASRQQPLRPTPIIRPTRLILASSSPQRRKILEQVGIPFVVRPARVEEETVGELSDLQKRQPSVRQGQFQQRIQ